MELSDWLLVWLGGPVLRSPRSASTAQTCPAHICSCHSPEWPGQRLLQALNPSDISSCPGGGSCGVTELRVLAPPSGRVALVSLLAL